jgi:hypothetical protein
LNHKAWKNAESALPATSGTLKVEGLQNPVTAFRDAWGVQTGFPCQNYPINSIQSRKGFVVAANQRMTADNFPYQVDFE